MSSSTLSRCQTDRAASAQLFCLPRGIFGQARLDDPQVATDAPDHAVVRIDRDGYVSLRLGNISEGGEQNCLSHATRTRDEAPVVAVTRSIGKTFSKEQFIAFSTDKRARPRTKSRAKGVVQHDVPSIASPSDSMPFFVVCYNYNEPQRTRGLLRDHLSFSDALT